MGGVGDESPTWLRLCAAQVLTDAMAAVNRTLGPGPYNKAAAECQGLMSQILQETGTLTDSGRLIQGYTGGCGNLSGSFADVDSQLGPQGGLASDGQPDTVGAQQNQDGSVELSVGPPRNAAVIDALHRLHIVVVLLLVAAVLL